jgi:hypothetical protein
VSGVRYCSRLSPDHTAEEQVAVLVERLPPHKHRLSDLRTGAVADDDPAISLHFWIYSDTTGGFALGFAFSIDMLTEIVALSAGLHLDVLFNPPRDEFWG